MGKIAAQCSICGDYHYKEDLSKTQPRTCVNCMKLQNQGGTRMSQMINNIKYYREVTKDTTYVIVGRDRKIKRFRHVDTNILYV